MNSLCSKCSTPLTAPWKFCPLCGTAAASQPPSPAPRLEHEKAPVQGAFGGLLFGVLVAPILIIVGTLLCLTGLGAFLGVPLIAIAVVAPLLGPLIGLGELKGSCPWCGAAIANITHTKGFACHACHQRILIENRKFVRVAG